MSIISIKLFSINSVHKYVNIFGYPLHKIYYHLSKKSHAYKVHRANMSSDACEEKTWRGVPLTEMYGAQSPWDVPEFPLVSPNSSHSVLYHIPSYGVDSQSPLKPQVRHDRWDGEHVRMPCSKHSLYKVEDRNGETHLQSRWELIESSLRRPIPNSRELADAILRYNNKFKGLWKFRALHKLFEEYLDEYESDIFFNVTLPEIVKLALDLPRLIQAPIPLLKQHKNHSISLTQQQIASLLANAFFCTFPRRNSYKSNSEYASFPSINMSGLYESSGADYVLEKLKCICFYFKTVCTKASVGVVSFSRRSVPLRHCPSWAHSTVPLAASPLHVDSKGTIEDADGLIQLDFANKYLGGGVLGRGCVQEEIRFVICPELMVSMLFTEVLAPNEAVMIIGAQRYSQYSGYGDSFHWSGALVDATPRDRSLRRRVAVLCLDALPPADPALQYRQTAIDRELNKAWVGFSFFSESHDPRSLNYPGLATGNWGCGAFGGSPQLKALLQIMAAAQARRPLAYFTFDDIRIRDYVLGMYNMMVRHNVTVGQLYRYLLNFHEERANDLPAFLRRRIEDANGAPKTPEVSTSAAKTEVKPVTVPTTNWTVTSNKTDKPQEKMDISSSEPSQECILSSDLEKEFLKDDLKDSPDLFADEEMDIAQVTKTPAGPLISQTTDEIDVAPKPSKLVEAMQKLDEQSSLNLSSTNASPFKTNSDVDQNTSDSPSNLKMKKMKIETPKNNRKITDFFSKKPTG